MIRRAEEKDIDELLKLLKQVNLVHHLVRPDIFKLGTKYGYNDLLNMVKDDAKPIFVYDDDGVKGYAFTVFQRHINDSILTDIKTLYIDDLCVDENSRGKHIGKSLYDYVIEFAKENDCHNVTLNVWYDNKNALAFYEKIGMNFLKVGMEKRLK